MKFAIVVEGYVLDWVSSWAKGGEGVAIVAFGKPCIVPLSTTDATVDLSSIRGRTNGLASDPFSRNCFMICDVITTKLIVFVIDQDI